MPVLPTSAAFTDGAVTQGGFKTAIAQQREFLAGLLGTDGTAATARAALGAASAGDLSAAVPAGAVVSFARNTAPTGWLKANGALLNRTTYAGLFAAIGTTFGAGDGSTTFGLPDLRGEFVRGWDDARGVDSGRVFGSAQAGQNESHTHAGTADAAGAHTHVQNYWSPMNSNSSGLLHSTHISTNSSGSVQATLTPTASAGAHSHTLSIAAAGGAEAHPRNIALLACIKY